MSAHGRKDSCSTLSAAKRSREESALEPAQLAAISEEIAHRVAEKVLSRVSADREWDPLQDLSRASSKQVDEGPLAISELARLRVENSRLRHENDTLKMALLSSTADCVEPDDISDAVKLVRTPR